MVEKEGVREGKRNATGFKLAMYYRRQGINEQPTLLEKMKEWNAKNNPPLDDKELSSIIQSALKYEIKNEVDEVKKEGSVDEENVLRTSCVIVEDVMYEQCMDEKEHCFFIREHPTNKLSYFTTTQVEKNGVVYKPIIGKEISKNISAVLLPSNANLYVDIEELINSIRKHIHTYCDVSEEFEQLATYYVLITYVFDQFTEIPYLSLMGDTGTGKTRARDVIGMICYKPIVTNGGASSAALYRITEKWKGSVLIDEADIKDSDEKHDIIKYYNCGYQKNSPIMKCDKNDPNKIDFFSPYCPKVITRRQPFEDKATESRCITEVMMTTGRNDIPYNLPPQFFSECLFLRNKLTAFRLACWKSYCNMSVDDANSFFKDIHIEPRLKQASNSIIYLLKPFPSLLEKFKLYLVKKQEELIVERADSFDGEIINAMHDLLVVAKRDLLTSQDIAEVLNKGVFDFKQKVDVRKIGKRLKSLGIKVDKPMWHGDVKVRAIIIDSGKMTELYKKYVIEFGTSGSSGTLYRNTPIICSTNQKADLEHLEGVFHYNVPNVPNVPNNDENLSDDVVLAKILKNYEKDNAEVLETAFGKEKIRNFVSQGIIFEFLPGSFKLL